MIAVIVSCSDKYILNVGCVSCILLLGAFMILLVAVTKYSRRKAKYEEERFYMVYNFRSLSSLMDVNPGVQAGILLAGLVSGSLR